MPSYVYLLASRPYGTLYLGVTSNLGQRIVQHKRKTFPGFSAKYGVDRLVWMEEYDRIVDAIAREKIIKNGGETGRSLWSKRRTRGGSIYSSD